MARPKKATSDWYVYSTLANDQKYQNYELVNGMSIPTDFVFIEGGTGVANDKFVTPLGTVTGITDAQYNVLQANPEFKKHIENGFIIVQKGAEDPETIAADMSMDDNSRPLVEGDSRMNLDAETQMIVGQ